MDLPFQAAVRRHDTTCLLSVLPRIAPRCRPHVSNVCPGMAFWFLFFASVPYLICGTRHFRRFFELREYLLADPIFGLLLCLRLNNFLAFAGIVPVIS